MSRIRVAVIGAAGRMGVETVAAIRAAEADPEGVLELVAAVDLNDDGEVDLGVLSDARVQVIVDFTHPDAVMNTLRWCIDHGINAVVGTTGFTDARLGELRTWVTESPEVGVLIVPNFSIGAILMMQFAEAAAAHFESVEIIELHHPNKADAPSGTARRTAERIAAARERAGVGPAPDATTEADLLPGARGASVADVPVHAVRLRGLVAHQEVLFGTQGETFSIRHDSFDRSSFMPGVLLGIRSVIGTPGLTVGLDQFLDLGHG